MYRLDIEEIKRSIGNDILSVLIQHDEVMKEIDRMMEHSSLTKSEKTILHNKIWQCSELAIQYGWLWEGQRSLCRVELESEKRNQQNLCK